MPDTILFYTSAQPGAQPFVRVPATPEGLRYAGYLARYKGLKSLNMTATPRPSGPLESCFVSGYHDYPRNPGIPVGTERFVVDIDGEPAWSRYTGDLGAGDVIMPSGWEPVPEGAPPPRGQ